MTIEKNKKMKSYFSRIHLEKCYCYTDADNAETFMVFIAIKHLYCLSFISF